MTRRQLLRNLDGRELVAWRVLEYIDPWGQSREDIREAHLATVIANCMGGKKSDGSSWKIDDFLLSFAEKVEEEVDPKKIEDAIKLWVNMNNLKYQMFPESVT
jgi:hypothetical protein